MAKRIRYKRGQKLPDGAVYCARPGIWGNPFKMKSEADRLIVIAWYRNWYQKKIREDPKKYLMPLLNKQLACYCPLDKACHVDVLLEFVNRAEAYIAFCKAWEGPVIEEQLVEHLIHLNNTEVH